MTARLVESPSDGVPKTSKYFTLSHCWGQNPSASVPKTTLENLSEMKDKINLRELTKTFQDALIITLELGLQYIWIDSLCIIQNDVMDFERECAMMGLIYSRSHCTISASGSTDGQGGCFIERDQLSIGRLSLTSQTWNTSKTASSENPLLSQAITISPLFPPWYISLKGPLITRGWTLQERELSPRVVHFTKNRLLWECRACNASENTGTTMHPKVHERPAVSRDEDILSTRPELRLLDTIILPLGKEELYQVWYRTVEQYSNRALSVSTDKLPALSGIVGAFSESFDHDTYVAGLWKRDAIRGLCWFPVRPLNQESQKVKHWPPPPTDSGIPSWSWASQHGTVGHYFHDWFAGVWEKQVTNGVESWARVASVVELIDISTTGVSQDRFGRVASGSLILQGWAVEITVSEANVKMPEKSATHVNPKVYIKYSANQRPSAHLYFDSDPVNLTKQTFLCLQLGTGTTRPRQDTVSKTINGLALMHIEGNDNLFRRVGMFDIVRDDTLWVENRCKKTVHIV